MMMMYDFSPGNTFEFGSFAMLRDFEDQVARQLKPELDPVAWSRRADIEGQLRPTGFNGILTQAILTTIENPYEVLGTQTRSVQTQSGGKTTPKASFKLRTADYDYYDENTVGFNFEGTFRNLPDTVHSKIFYVPLPVRRYRQNPPKNASLDQTYSSNYYGAWYDVKNGQRVWYERRDANSAATLRRAVTKPVCNQKSLDTFVLGGSLSLGANPRPVPRSTRGPRIDGSNG